MATEENIEEAQTIAEEMKQDESFDLVEALAGVSYPEGEVTVYTDGRNAKRLEEVGEELSKLAYAAAAADADNGTIVESPEKVEIDKQIEELEAEQRALIAKVAESALTFHMRGVAPEQWRLIVKKWRRKLKVAKEDKHDEDAVVEAQEAQLQKIDAELVAVAIKKIVNAKGNADTRAVTVETAEKLRGILLQTEWERVLDKANTLTFANSLFLNVKAQDADFLSES